MPKNIQQTQVSRAKREEITAEMEAVAHQEGVEAAVLMDRVARGTVVIPKNTLRKDSTPCGIGQGLRVKVNANIGTSEAFPRIEGEKIKLQAAIQAGADAVMDLSTGGDLQETLKMVLDNSPVPVGSVPVYGAAVLARVNRGGVLKMEEDDLFDTIEEHAASGVDFLTLHCGLTMNVLEQLRAEKRIMGIVSRGGAIMAGWMLEREQENPLYKNYDRLLEIARRYDVTLSLGDGLRPGCLEDATDRAQVQELLVLGELVQRAREAEVQVMVEGPGHVPFNQVEMNMTMAKSLCRNAPFYVLGPLVTDVAPGYDHISAAIGGTMAALAGADFLCYVTPAEHLGLPGPEEVHQGVISSRLAAHAADLARGREASLQWDRNMSLARKNLDWEAQLQLAMDPQRARSLYEQLHSQKQEECTMCGSYCALKMVKDL